ncbi:hypothetical protein YM304_16550 [Ilumatobacter coccineus YM16-304]|uniref:Endonuclease/exonuclease/phosphatase domain-containing protein n=1 Tax=Ilumatobacter coccineus (strain NBRC 103263 / KCTC 29153 / YM16-304) TaxID=1313172 RepID=A0A6C7E9S3_ILUCY|nr:hypothetical protein YM304_16550 [Ilumatobacter coccineus YM16-304]
MVRVETTGLEWAVLSWNVQGTKHTDLERVADVIRNESPDVVVLQEIRRSQATELAERLQMKFTWSFKHHVFSPFFRDRAEGAAILTPHALDAAAHTVISEATSRRSYKRRIAQWALVGRPDTSAYRIYNVHLSPHNRPDQRRLEAIRVAGLVAEHGDSPPAIVAGDFNDAGEPIVIATLPGIEHVPPPPTNPSDDPIACLDHVLVPAEARDVSVSVPAGGADWAELSDHLPVTVRFTLDWVQGGFAPPRP